MPLHLTKIAFGCDSAADLAGRLQSRADAGEVRLTTRYCPKRVDEMAGGSLYWILAHRIIGRSPILGFEDNGEGRYWLRIAPQFVPVRPVPRRAHQGWRYLEQQDAPPDLDGAAGEGDALPADLAEALQRLALL